MNKLKIILLSLILVTSIAAVPALSYAIDLDLGAVMAVHGWVPVFKNLANGQEKAFPSFGEKFDSGACFMLGPRFWFGLPGGWGLGLQFLAGVNKNDFEYRQFGFESVMWNGFNPLLRIEDGKVEVRRYDTKLTFDKTVAKSVRIKIGLKFDYSGGDGNYYRIGIPGGPFDWGFEEDINTWYLGPTVGFDVRHHVGSGVHINAGLDLLMLFGKFNWERSNTFYYGTGLPISLIVPFEYDPSFVVIGFDSFFGISYFIDPANLDISAVFRYQMMPHISISDSPSVPEFSYKNDWITGEIDHVFGLIFAITYKFGR